MKSQTFEDSLTFAGIRFRGATSDHVWQQQTELKLVFPVNAELILMAQDNPRFRDVLSRHISTFDGFWPHLIARVKTRKPIEKISGSEFVHNVFVRAAKANSRVFLLGAIPDVNLAARKNIASRYGIEVDGYSPEFERYPYREETTNRILDEIQRSRPQIILVALGAPKQEFWLDEHYSELSRFGVQMAMAVGGTLDMLAGVYRKAPGIVCAIGLEGVWRALLDPKRIKRFPNPIRFFRVALFERPSVEV